MTEAQAAKILVVDDEEIIRIGCQRVLEEYNHQVDLAENGQVAFEKLQKNSYDLVLVDMMMPVMGGMELLEKIKKLDPNIIPIVISAYATIETAVDAVKKGAYDYLPKPFTPDELVGKVNRGLEKRRLRLEAQKLREERDRNLFECSTEKTRTRTIIDSMSEGLIATNRNGQIVLVNPAALKMLRLKGEKVIGHKIDGLLGNSELEQNIKKSLDKVIRKATLTRLEITTSDGRVLQSSITPIIDDQGECLGTVTVLIDITEEKKIEKIKSHFLRMVSHEIKSPIAAIEGYLNLILDGFVKGDPKKEREIIQKTRDKAHSLLEMVNDLLDLSRTREKTSKIMESLNLRDILADTVEFYKVQAKEKEISLTFHCPPSLPNIRGNAEEISRLFDNLISNAIKYTPSQGKVSVDVESDHAHVIVAISDTGIGMSESEVAKIFDEFYRAQNAIAKKISGTGLGLAIAKKIAEDHQGFIEVESKLDEGSTFRVILPLEKRANYAIERDH